MLCFWKLSQKSLERIVGGLAEIWSGLPRNTSQKNYHSNQYALPETVLNVWLSLRRQRNFSFRTIHNDSTGMCSKRDIT